ncbi:MAG: hypothetical protein CMM07_25680 [Rhodopirellula sp.]|nr:hypothetical protein [Rhodopirellula sp.]
MNVEERIKLIARQCACAGLGLYDSRALFESLCIADALIQEKGDVNKATARLGVKRTFISRRRRQGSIKVRGSE